MRLKKGSSALEFSITDIFGKKISLTDYSDQKLMLSFYRYASCPLCNLRVDQLIQEYDKLSSNGLSMIAFFQSPKESILKYVGKQDAPFPIIADLDRKIYKLYGVEHSWIGYIRGGLSRTMFRALKSGFRFGKMEGKRDLLPADFLIKDFKVHTAFYGKKISDHIPLEEIEAFLKEI